MTNDDSLSREQLLKGVVSAGLIGIGFFSGSALPGLVRAIAGGLGGNWLSNLAEEAFADYCKRRFKTDGALNHDLRGALECSFQAAVQQLQAEWPKTDAYTQLEQRDAFHANLTRKALQWLQEDAERFFKHAQQTTEAGFAWDAVLADPQTEAKLLALVQDHSLTAPLPLLADLMRPLLAEPLKGRPEAFRAFVAERLLASWLLRFRYELRDDHRARVAYENLWQTSISNF